MGAGKNGGRVSRVTASEVPQPILGFASGVEDPQTLFRPGLFLPTLGFPLLRHFDSSLRAIVDQSARNEERADA